MLKRLRGGGRSGGEIAEGDEVSRPAVSQHLKVLKTARLVTVHAVGTRRVYAVDARGLKALRDWFDGSGTELHGFQGGSRTRGIQADEDKKEPLKIQQEVLGSVLLAERSRNRRSRVLPDARGEYADEESVPELHVDRGAGCDRSHGELGPGTDAGR